MNLAARKQRGDNVAPGGRRSRTASGKVTPTLVGLLCLGLLLVSYNHIRGNFHRLRTAVLKPEPPPPRPIAGPGGQPPVVLARSVSTLGAVPEFTSVTLLPGRGMEVLQISALIPGRGEISVLSSPSVDNIGSVMTDTGADASGRLSTTFGGALLAPWAGNLTGTPTGDDHVDVNLLGRRVSVPAQRSGISTEGLLLDRAADTVQTGVLTDGQFAEALFKLGNFGGVWPSSLQLTSRVELSGQSIEMTLTGRNVGQSILPLGLGWRPYLAVPGGDRSNATLYVPSSAVALTDHRTGLPTGAWETAQQAGEYLGKPGGVTLESNDINATYGDLQRAVVADGPMIELRDPGFDYGLRITLLSDTISTVHVEAPHDQQWVSVEADTNAPDPLGHQWSTSDTYGLRMLKPGESLVWRVRLEIFSLANSKAAESAR